jgi:hypothetical protein
MQELTLSVNVGMGATDPMAKLQRLLQGIQAYASVAMQPPPNLNLNEVGKEIFGFLGYQDGGRFLQEGEDPRIGQLTQALQQAKGQLDNKALEHDAKVKVAAINADTQTKIAADAHATQQEIADKQIQAQKEANMSAEVMQMRDHAVKKIGLLADHAHHQDDITMRGLETRIKHAIEMKKIEAKPATGTTH